MDSDAKGCLILILFVIVLAILSSLGDDHKYREVDPDIEVHQQYGGR